MINFETAVRSVLLEKAWFLKYSYQYLNTLIILPNSEGAERIAFDVRFGNKDLERSKAKQHCKKTEARTWEPPLTKPQPPRFQ